MTAIYNSKQAVLYMLAKIVISNLNADLQLFNALKSKYDANFITNLFADLQNAMGIEDAQARNAKYQAIRQDLEAKAKTLQSKFQILKSYISDAYFMNDARIASENDAAGQKYYAGVTNKDWSALTGLANAMKLYVANNQLDLINNGYMPTSFIQDIDAISGDCVQIFQDYVQARQLSAQGSNEKVSVNNALYKKIASVCADGQIVFAENDAKLPNYTISTIQTLIDGNGTSGIRGMISDANGNPIANAKITIVETSQSTTSDNNGKYAFKGLTAKDYNVTISAANFEDETDTIVVESGVMSGYNYSLQSI